MQLTAILLLTAGLYVSATGVSQNITYSGKDVAVKKIFSVIEQQTGYVIFYDDGLLKKTRLVTINVVKASLSHFLELVMEGQPLDYAIRKKLLLSVGNLQV